MPTITTPQPAGGETLVNSYTDGRQEGARVTPLTDGGYVVTWQSLDQPGDNGWGVYAQRFNADGTANGSELHVNTTLGDHQAGATAVAQADGGFTVLWSGWSGGDSSNLDVYAQRFTASGEKTGGELGIATTGAHEQRVDAKLLPDGSFIVSWQQPPSEGGTTQMVAQHFDADWNTIGGSFAAGKPFTPSGGSTYLSDGPGALTALQDGNFVSVWTEPEAGGSSSDVWAQILSPTGSPAGDAFRVNAATAGAQGQPAAATLADGSFVVTYYSGGAGGVMFQHFQADGSTAGAETVAYNGFNGATQPAIAALDDGGFLITWTGATDGDGSSVSGQRYAADDSPVGDSFLLNSTAAGWESQSAVAQLQDGTVVTAWTDDTQGATGTNIETQQFTICFYPGTLVATPAGPRAVETLAIGDLVLTSGGDAMPIRWMGRQTIHTRFADKRRTLPVRIPAGALGDGLPGRDLLVSPRHALLLDGILVEAGALLGLPGIVQETQVPESFTYYHVELWDHALVLAEGVPAETFVDNVARENFDNWAEHEALYGHLAPIAELDLPRAQSFRQLPPALKARLGARQAA